MSLSLTRQYPKAMMLYDFDMEHDMHRRFIHLLALTLHSLTVFSCSTSPLTLRLATTTSTYDSGLLDAILPSFEVEFSATVDVIAVGTGQAIAIAERGDADVILVHAKQREEAFIEAGHGVERYPVMFNDFVLVGPIEDPAGVDGIELAAEALRIIADKEAPFASRGDDSGTHTRELLLWEEAGIEPSPRSAWYASLGQGMGETLQYTQETLSYTLTDRGTYLAQHENLPDLVIMVGGESIDENQDPNLLNPYGIIQVNPDVHPQVQEELAQQFIEWIRSDAIQAEIGVYGIEIFGQTLFYPDAASSP
jgi:tungstate transport system substrate-binding protein